MKINNLLNPVEEREKSNVEFNSSKKKRKNVDLILKGKRKKKK